MQEQWTWEEVFKAAWLWYKSGDIDSMCLAENRLNRGERPDNWKTMKKGA